MTVAGSAVIVDAGLCNLRSVQRALEHAGVAAPISADPDAVARADRVVVPGQGAFSDFVAGLAGGLGEAIVAAIRAGTPYLGICLGLQVLLDGSEEGEPRAGLGVVPGRVRRLRVAPLPLPHVGWNEVAFSDGGAADYYFAHSYVAEPDDPTWVWGGCDYGGRFVAALRRDQVWAVQFHPEKSDRAGHELLARFLAR